MKHLVYILFLISSVAFAQVTKNPKVAEKSTQDTYINRITITEDYTIVSMQHKVPTTSKGNTEEQMKEYFEANPREKEQLSRMNPILRDMLLQQMFGGQGTMSLANISIQPETFLKAPDGRTYSYIKADNIPEAPQTQEVEAGKDYFFRVYFEKLDPGVTEIDLIESDVARDGTMTYWNFYGVEVNNPADGEVAMEEQALEVPAEIRRKEVLVSGKILDLDTKKPIRAKIVVSIDGNESKYDSIVTSRTGYFEFILPNTSTTFEVAADSYDPTTQAIDLSRSSKDELNYDIYLEAPFVTPPKEIEETEDEEAFEEEVNEEEESVDLELNEDLEMVDKSTIRLSHVLFILGKDEIILSSYRELNKLVDLLEENPNMEIKILGHTDNQGDEKLNKDLSLDRAKAVKRYLEEKGISDERMTCEGMGSTKPAFPNDSEANRQKNRRVEVEIVKD